VYHRFCQRREEQTVSFTKVRRRRVDMSGAENVTDGQQLLERLSRQSLSETKETLVVISPGARVTSWVVKVKSLLSYNWYNVRVVEMGELGSLLVEYGSQMKAVNLAESSLEDGQLSAGTRVLMCRVGGKNVFYAPM
jgi:hypothetical protein